MEELTTRMVVGHLSAEEAAEEYVVLARLVIQMIEDYGMHTCSAIVDHGLCFLPVETDVVLTSGSFSDAAEEEKRQRDDIVRKQNLQRSVSLLSRSTPESEEHYDMDADILPHGISSRPMAGARQFQPFSPNPSAL